MGKGKKINVEKLKNKVKDAIDNIVSKAREKELEAIRITLNDISAYQNIPYSSLYNHSIYHYIKDNYESVVYKRYKGLTINCEEWVKERKEERQKIAEKKDNENWKRDPKRGKRWDF